MTGFFKEDPSVFGFRPNYDRIAGSATARATKALILLGWLQENKNREPFSTEALSEE
jgi:hypothetical protein